MVDIAWPHIGCTYSLLRRLKISLSRNVGHTWTRWKMAGHYTWELLTQRDAHQLRFPSTHRLLSLVSAEIPCGIEPLRRVLVALLKGKSTRGMPLQWDDGEIYCT